MKHIKLFYCAVLLLLLLSLPMILSSCMQGCDHPNLGESVIKPTCDKEGKTIHQCADCSFVFITDIQPSTGHTLSKKVIAPDCETEGYTVFSCDCGYSYRAAFEEPLGHKYTTVTQSPTCTDPGFTVYTCDCDYSYTGEYLTPTGHSYKTTVTAPTCTTEGFTEYSCTCGYSYQAELKAPTGHTFSKAVTRPTVSGMGYTIYTCNCGFEYAGSYTFYRDILKDAYAQNSTVLARGIDVSQHNHKKDAAGNYLPLDWAAIKAAGIDYVILKAGSTVRGTKGGLEPTFQMDYEGAKAAGLHVGAYFYTYSTNVDSIRADAAFLKGWLGDKKFEYPIYLDLEDDTLRELLPGQLTELCVAFCSSLQASGYYTGIYTNQDWLVNELEYDKMISLFEIWYARYPSGEDTPAWNEESYGKHLGMWQFSNQGSFEAIPDTVFDLNYAYKNYPKLIQDLELNGYTKA